MGRRRSNSAGGLVEVAASLPWWLGVVLAGVSYLAMTWLTQRPMTQAGSLKMVEVMVTGAAGAGRYVLPIIFLTGAVMSAVSRARRKQLFSDASGDSGEEAIRAMSWQQFEALVGEAFRRQGFRVVETGGGGADGGIDLILQKDGQTSLVQCKHWKAFKVGVQVVREQYGLMAHQGAVAGYVITSGRFTDEARQFSRGKPLTLIDGPALAKLLRAEREGPAEVPAQPLPQTAPSQSTVPSCPSCGKTMVRRVASKGEQRGRSFWGCSTYPACRGTRPTE